MRFFKWTFLILVIFYLLPGLAAAGFWLSLRHPAGWREANWSSAGILPAPNTDPAARVTIFAARTGGFKGAFSVHCWIVLKGKDAGHYDRYDVVGWGDPVRHNAYAPDGYWYSNSPEIVWQATGARAELLLPQIERAIARYPNNRKGSYRLWPGPNSNTFIAYLMRQVPEIDAVLPANAVGRDFPAQGQLVSASNGEVRLTAPYGLFGLAAGKKSGLEVNVLGLVAGVDFQRPGVKIPAWGTVGF